MTQWKGNSPLIDIMCGSGTFLIEAINQILKVPLKFQQVYLFENWLDFKKEIFINERSKAKNKVINYKKLSNVIGCEINNKVFDQAKVNI